MTNKFSLATLALPLIAASVESVALTKQALLAAMNANGRQLTAYQWKQTVTVVRKGVPLDPVIEEIRLDASGQMQRNTLVKPAEKSRGPLRARKAAEIKESVQQVMQLARVYANPQQIAQAVNKGQIWDGQESLRVQARALVVPADDMTMNVNAATYNATHIHFNTQYEGSPVTIAIDYEQLPNGPSIMRRMIVRIPAEDIVVNVVSYDFQRFAAIH